MSHPILPSAPPATNPEIERLQGRVDAAAFALLREGRNPTIASIRARIGGASPNLVAPALQRWRLSFAAQLDSNAGSALEVLPPGVLELVQALWSRALFEAHRVRDDVPAGVDQIDRVNELLEQLRAQTSRLQERAARLEELSLALEAQKKRLSALESKLTARPAAKRRNRPSRVVPKSPPRVLSRRAPATKPGRRGLSRSRKR
jgi:hypothetical protein